MTKGSLEDALQNKVKTLKFTLFISTHQKQQVRGYALVY